MRPLTRGGTPRALGATATVAYVVARDVDVLTLTLHCMGAFERDIDVDVTNHVSELVCLTAVMDLPNVGDVLCTETGARIGFFVGLNSNDRRRLRIARVADAEQLAGTRLYTCNADGFGGRARFTDPDLLPEAAVQFIGDVIEEQSPVIPGAHTSQIRLVPGARSTVLHGIPLQRGVVVTLRADTFDGISYSGYTE